MKILVINTAALGYQTWERENKAAFWKKFEISPAKTVFPALTCPVQASFRTALEPEEHGMPANGFFSREIRKTFFWEQSSNLYDGARIWDDFRNKNGKVAQICWQQSIGNDSDLIISPAPIHKHHGGMIQDCYATPPILYRNLCEKIGRKFNLHDYWGPFTSSASTEWIANSACEIIKDELAQLIMVYLPHLDYDMQRHGPDSPKTTAAFSLIERELEKLCDAAKSKSYETIIFGDYAITPAEKVVYPNKILIENGLFKVREIGGMLYPDLYASPAFALCDHQIANVYVSNPEAVASVEKSFQGCEGIARAIRTGRKGRAGDIILAAEEGAWFSYRWWEKKNESPEYASHVDIHNKPGFDPCELFLSLWPPFSISTDDSKIKGTHGLNANPAHDVLLAATFKLPNQPKSIIELSRAVKNLISK
jgi:predicted AlkP superfamily pyrophosphatase or phosphodiesterase